MGPVVKKTTWGWIAAGVAAVGAIAVVVYEELKPASKNPPAPPGPSQQQLTPGHRYSLMLSCPTPVAPLFPPPPVPPEAAAAILLAGVPVVPQSFSASPDGKSVILVFDYTGTSVLPLPAIQSSGATACQTQLVDQGATPITVNGPRGSGGNQFHGPQNVVLMNGQTGSAGNVKGGAVVVTTQGTITGINGAPVKSWAIGSNSNQATIILSGTAGTIAVTWNNGTPQGGSIQVS